MFAIVSVLLDSTSTIERKKLLNSIHSTYLFKVKNQHQEIISWLVDLNKSFKVTKFKSKSNQKLSKSTVIIEILDADLVKVASGQVSILSLDPLRSLNNSTNNFIQQLNPQKLLAAKRMTVRGNIDRAMLIQKIISQERTKLEALKLPSFLTNGEGEGEGEKKKERGRWAAVTSSAKSKL